MTAWEKKKSWTLTTADELPSLVTQLIPFLSKKTILCLDGPMGAGKTTLVRELLKFYSVSGVVSPTFALQHRYQLQDLEVDHWDLYRLESEDDLESAGFWESFQDLAGLEFSRWVVVEWSEKVNEELWPRDWSLLRLKISTTSTERFFELSQRI